MQINNPLQINDWEINKFLKVVLAIQFALWGAIGLDAIGIQIPIIRQFISFIYLTFVPGIIILRILKLHKLGNIETLLYTVGLSIATLMFTGLFMNTVYPVFGISGPISAVPLIITISVVVLILCVLSYVRDKDFADPSFIETGTVLSPPALFLCLVPFLAIFGTYLVNYHQNNIILMFLIVIIALIAILIGFDKFIPKNLYPLAVFVIAISLLYHSQLISPYLTGYDVHGECFIGNLVKMDSIWDPSYPGNLNAMLSVSMLPPFYSIITNMGVPWCFKLIWPFFFSLVPLGLYRVFQKQTNDKIAFLSCFFFIAYPTFFVMSPGRQFIAELFLVLLILLMIDKDMNRAKQSFLFIVFGISVVISHYAISYFYMFCLIAVWALLALAEPIFSATGDRAITTTFVLLFVTFTLGWYMYVSLSTPFETIIRLGQHIESSIATELLDPESVEGLNIILSEIEKPSLLHKITKYNHLIAQFFVTVGVLTLMIKRKDENMKFEREYAAMSYYSFAICLAAISVPHFAAVGASRLFHITLIFLAPFCVIGVITLFKLMSKVVRASLTDQRLNSSLKVLSVFFVIFLLFNTGFVYEITKDRPGSFALSQEWINECGDAQEKVYFYTGYYPEQDIFGVKWVSKKWNNESIIYADYWHALLAFSSYGTMLKKSALIPTTKVSESSYVYLGYLNVRYGIMNANGWYYHLTDLSTLLNESSRIYSNGGAEVYYR